MLFIYPTPHYPRKPAEYAFKFIYLLTMVIHVIAMVVLITDFYTRLKDSMPYYFTRSALELSPAIEIVMANCTYYGELHLGNVRGVVGADIGAVTIGLMNMAMYVQGLFVLEFLTICTMGFASSNYSAGTRHLRAFGLAVPLYHILVIALYVYAVAVIVLTWVYDGNRRYFHAALVFCADQLRARAPEALLDAEYDDYSIFTTAVYWPFAATCVGLAVFIAAAIVLFHNSYDKATTLLAEADVPWEGAGVLSAPKKPLLKLHTAQRNAIIDDARAAIKQGEKVRIVRSYQLMTEDDFNALVQAMRDQVARAMKEKQFEKMRENFGDNESQIDDMGFLWRQHVGRNAQQPQQQSQDGREGSADQFYDVNFDDYFTDNDYGNITNGMGGGGGGPGGEFDGNNMPFTNDHGGRPSDIIEYTSEPLFPPEDGYGEGGSVPALYYDDGTTGEGGYGDDVDDNNGYNDYDDDGGQQQQQRRHRRSSSHRNRNRDDYDYDGSYYDREPDPRSPSGGGDSRYSPQEGRRGYDDDDDDAYYGNNNGGAGQSRRRGGPQQAEVEDDLVDADALSFDDAFH